MEIKLMISPEVVVPIRIWACWINSRQYVMNTKKRIESSWNHKAIRVINGQKVEYRIEPIISKEKKEVLTHHLMSIPSQKNSAVLTEWTERSIYELIDKGELTEEDASMLRCWVHTHAGGATPSGTDDQTFDSHIQDNPPYFVAVIIGESEIRARVYDRELKVRIEDVPIRIDYSEILPIDLYDKLNERIAIDVPKAIEPLCLEGSETKKNGKKGKKPKDAYREEWKHFIESLPLYQKMANRQSVNAPPIRDSILDDDRNYESPDL